MITKLFGKDDQADDYCHDNDIVDFTVVPFYRLRLLTSSIRQPVFAPKKST